MERENITFYVFVKHQASVASLPYPDAAFDKVFSSNTFQFWPDQAANLREVRRVLKPDGNLVIVLQPRWAKTDDEVRAVARAKPPTRSLPPDFVRSG